MNSTHRIILLLMIVVSVSILGMASRLWILDVPEYGRLCGSANPAWWCSLREIIINPHVYIASLICGLLALRRASLNWSFVSIAIGVLGLFSFNPAWNMAYPDWSIAGLLVGLFALMRN